MQISSLSEPFPMELPYVFDTIHARDVIYKFIAYNEEQADQYWVMYRQGYPLAFFSRKWSLRFVEEGKHYLKLWEAKYLSQWLETNPEQMISIVERHQYP